MNLQDIMALVINFASRCSVCKASRPEYIYLYIEDGEAAYRYYCANCKKVLQIDAIGRMWLSSILEWIHTRTRP